MRILVLTLLLASIQAVSSDDTVIIVPTPELGIHTLQDGIDAIPEKGTIIYRVPYHRFNDSNPEGFRIENKKIHIIGQTESNTRPVLEANRFIHPAMIEVVGRADVTIENIFFIKGRTAIVATETEAGKPNLTVKSIETTLSVRGIYGKVKNFIGRAIRMNGNEGSGIILTSFKSVSIKPEGPYGGSTFANGTSYGLFLRSEEKEVKVELENINVDRMPSGGIWLYGLRGLINLKNISGYQPKNFGIAVSFSEHVSITNANFTQVQHGIYRGDGLVIEQSNVSVNGLNISQPYGNGIVAVGCEEVAPKMNLDLYNARVFLPGGSSWISGRLGQCPASEWNWFVSSAIDDEIFGDGFELPLETSNSCVEQPWGPPTPCRAVHRDSMYPMTPPQFSN